MRPQQSTLALFGLERGFVYLAVLPPLALIGALLFYPIGYSFYLGLTNSDGVTGRFIGLRNYIELASDPTFRSVLLTNAMFLVSVPLILVASLVSAVLMYEQVWGWRLFRVLFFLPSVLSTVVIGILFRAFFAYDGPVNTLLKAAGHKPVDWLGNGGTAIAVIVLALLWSGFGYGMLILLAGMANIDPDIYAAARLDGANWLERLWDITLPLISKVLGFVSIINVAYTFTSLFGFIFVMTSGGPGFSTTTLDYLVYLKAFVGTEVGKGSALGFMLFLIIMILTIAQLRFFRGAEGVE